MSRLTCLIAICVSIPQVGCAAYSLRPTMPMVSSSTIDGDEYVRYATFFDEDGAAINEITATRVINAPKDQVWAVMADYENIFAYVSSVKNSEHIGGPHQGVGAVRRCDVMMGMELTEEVVAWEEGRSYTVSVRSSMPTNPHYATLAVKELGPSQTEMKFVMQYQMKGGVFGKVMNAVMMRSFMKRNMDGMLKDISDYVTSEPIDAMADSMAGG